MYYYNDGENEVGPFDAEKLQKLSSAGLLSAGTLVRAAGSNSWGPYGQLEPGGSANGPHPAEEAVISRIEVTPTEGASGTELPVDDNWTTTLQNTDNSEVVRPTGLLANSSLWLSHPPTPWRRYGARMLDTTVNGALIIFLFAIAFYAVAPASADEFFLSLGGESGQFIDVIITAFSASFLSGLLVGVSGFTLGKWIFGVRVTNPDGSRLGIGEGLSRDFTVLLKGMGLGIPIFAIFTMASAYRRLKERNATSWDEGKYLVWHRPSGVSQYILNFVGLLLIVLMLGVVATLGAL
jgi:uncharacterized RDD family membrane protein YckC